jgi:UDP-3-O-[3-hydroxymyristoyl] glucosamine N-acyltransferase
VSKLTVKQLAEIVGGELEGDAARPVEGAASLVEATELDASFLADAKLEGSLATTKAACVLLEPSKKPAREALGADARWAAVYVADPKRAFSRVLEHFAAQASPKLPTGYHPTAVISPYARIGKDVHVGPHAVVEAGAVIGDGTRISAQVYVGHNTTTGKKCLLYPQVVVRERCSLGDRVIVHSGAVIGGDGFGYLSGPEGHVKIPQIGRVEIGDDVEIGSNTTVDRATTGVTRIGRGTKIDNLSQIAHNVQIGEHCMIVSQVGVSGSCELGKFVVLGGQVGLADHLKLGDGVQVGAQSGLMADVEAGTIVFGSPARPIREAFKLTALLGKLPEMYDFIKKLKKAEGKETQKTS